MAPTVALPNLRGSIQEVTFAQRLADNSKTVRDRALKKLKAFLSLKSSRGPGFSDDDALKIWKGLFYCMYMADKPLVQEEVADEMSVLIHDLGNIEDCRTFTRAAFRTFAREWDGIDIYRIDKFMMFVRRVLRQMFVHLRNQHWDIKEVAQYIDILDTTIIRADDDLHNISLGIKLHLCSIILEEFAKIGGEKLKHDVIVAVIQPYMKVLALSKVEPYRKAVKNQVFRHLIRQSDVGVEYEQGNADDSDNEEACDAVEGNEASKENEDISEIRTDDGVPTILDPRAGDVDVIIPQIYPDFKLLAEALQNLGSLDKVRRENRLVIYSLVSEFQDVAQGGYPLGLPEDNFDDEEENFVTFRDSVQKMLDFNESLMNPVKTSKEQLDDLKSDPLSNYSIRKAEDRKPKKKKLKKTKKNIRTLKEKKAIAKEQKMSALALKVTVEDHLSQITETVKKVKKRKEPSVDDKPSEEMGIKKNKKKRKEKETESPKSGGFEVSAIRDRQNKAKSKLIPDVGNFEVSAMNDINIGGFKRKGEIDSEVSSKKLKKSVDVEESTNLGNGKKSKVGKKKAKKAHSAKVKAAGDNSFGEREDIKLSSANLNKSNSVNGQDEVEELFLRGKMKVLQKGKLTVEKKEKSVKKSKAEKSILNNSFDVPDFASSVEEVSQENFSTNTGSLKKMVNVQSKTGQSPIEMSKKKMSVSGIVIENIMVKLKDTPNKNETQPNEASVDSTLKSPTLKTPSKTKPTKNAGLVMNFANTNRGSIWSKPIKEGEIEIFIKSKRQLKQEKKKSKNAALISPKVTPKTPKERTIKINLKQNQEQYIKDYEKSVRNSPQIPFSADRVPKAPVLKPSPSPILIKRPGLKILKNVIRKTTPAAQTPTLSLKAKSPKVKAKKRSKASDFF